MKILIVSADSLSGQQLFLGLEEAGHQVSSRASSDFQNSEKLGDLNDIESIVYIEPVQTDFANLNRDFARYIQEFKNCLDLGFRSKIQNFILVSRAEDMCGDAIHWPADERSGLFASSLYGALRVAYESLLNNITSDKRFAGEISNPQDGIMSHYFTWASLRMSYVYGIPGVQDDLNAWIEQLKNGKAPEIAGDGLRQRDYLYYKDAIEAVLLTLSASKEVLLDSAFNISTGIGTTDLQAFQHILHQAKKWVLQNVSQGPQKNILSISSPNFSPYEFGSLKKSVLNPSRAEAILGWRPKTSFEVGLDQVLNQLLK